MTHLRIHSWFSLLHSTVTVEALVDRAAVAGMTSLALTDFNALYGAVAFGRACHARAVSPIIGMTVTVRPLPGIAPSRHTTPGQLVLLAKGETGYRSLCRLSSHIQGAPDRETRARHGISWETLAAYPHDLICLSGGRRGWIERMVRMGDAGAAAHYAGKLAGIYGDDAYLALEIHRTADAPVARAVAELGKQFGLPPVAVHPVYCLDVVDRPRLRLLAAIAGNCRLDELPDSALPDEGEADVDLHWLDPDDMAARYAEFPAALAATSAIAARCRPALPDGRPVWPKPKLPADQTPKKALDALTRAGLARHYGSNPAAAIQTRLDRELAAIDRSGFTPLFLVVADIVRRARAKDVPVSTRGSVADSLAAYCAGITTIDPIAHDLLFERFLNPARASLPDIDLDFCSRRRDEVLAYVRDTYGEEHVALVATVSTMRPKSAVRETCKAYGLDEAAIKRLIKLLPGGWHPDPRRRDRRGVEEVVAQLEETRLQRIVREAYAIVGQPHHLSIHPGGVIITPEPLTDYVPLQWTAKGYLITQFDHGDVEAIGLPKIDLLGIRALTVLADATDLVRRRHAPDFTLDAIPADDAATGDMLETGATIGVFQCESTGAQRTQRQLKARTVQDLAVANAFFKPGPATGGMAAAFVRRYRGEEATAYLHPVLEPILYPTKGVLLFQEQILRIATEIAGLSWAEADHLRRGMSKFETKEMAAIREGFIAGCCRAAPHGPGFSNRQATTLWQQVEAFAGYGFNQGHATAYADVSYRSAYLKAHWPAEFLCARLQDWGGFHHQAVYIAEAQRLGMRVRPPHVNRSRRKFTLSDDDSMPALWMGLGQVRDLRRRAVAGIIAQRRRHPFAGLRDLVQRVALQPKEITHLIQCGALDGLGANRATLLAEADDLASAGSVAQMAFDFVTVTAEPDTAAQRLQWERRLLGQPLSVHPLDLVELPPDTVALSGISVSNGRSIVVAGTRLPGWTGGKGFFLGDRTGFVVAVPDENSPKFDMWQPVLVHGHWQQDAWGGGRLAVTSSRTLVP